MKSITASFGEVVCNVAVLLASVFIASASQATTASGEIFPSGPDLTMTPGSLCEHAYQLRYPEQIAYCRRNVESQTKQLVIDHYNALGYEITPSNRADFKIDHLIPLCAGGSNNINNLWPQHKTIYQQTDPIEPLICNKMQAGVLKQAHAVELILRAKLNLGLVATVIRELEAL